MDGRTYAYIALLGRCGRGWHDVWTCDGFLLVGFLMADTECSFLGGWVERNDALIGLTW